MRLNSLLQKYKISREEFYRLPINERIELRMRFKEIDEDNKYSLSVKYMSEILLFFYFSLLICYSSSNPIILSSGIIFALIFSLKYLIFVTAIMFILDIIVVIKTVKRRDKLFSSLLEFYFKTKKSKKN